MFKRGLAARVARAAFFRRHNDIDVFVEDFSAETRKLFSLMLTGALGREMRVEYINPLGPRSDVIEACRAFASTGSRRRVFVIDGDLELCCSCSVGFLPRLFVLPRYCIENFLVDGRAASQVIAANSLILSAQEAEAALDFGSWLQENAGSLHLLYLAYAAVRITDPAVQTVAHPLRNLLSDDSGVVDALKVEERVMFLQLHVDSVEGEGAFARLVEAIREFRTEDSVDFVLKYVSGKDVLLPLLKMRMNKVERMARGMALFKLDLANHVQPAELSAIESVAA